MMIREEIASSLELVSDFVSRIIDKVRSLSFTEEELFGIRLSLEEALINAIKHGNKENPDLTVQVKVDLQSDAIVFEVIDKGEGFDFRSHPDSPSQEHLHRPSGRGIFLIKSLMDEVEFFSSGRGIKMTKFIRSNKEAGSEHK